MAGDDLARLIGYDFARFDLLADALTHPSALPAPRRPGRRRGRPAPAGNYQRLEFLGDRVLGLIVADLLWHRFADEPEGPLTRRHAQLVRRDTLASIAGEIGIGPHIKMSPGEAASGAAAKPSILADVLEALVAAIYLDGGFAAAAEFVKQRWGPRIAAMQGPPRDPKTVLQEWAQARGLPLPAYQLIETSGPDHAPRFTVAVSAGSADASATASSKRAAETGAAEALLARLNDDG